MAYTFELCGSGTFACTAILTTCAKDILLTFHQSCFQMELDTTVLLLFTKILLVNTFDFSLFLLTFGTAMQCRTHFLNACIHVLGGGEFFLN